MIINPLERRRAEEFACRLDSDGTAHPHSSDDRRASGATETELIELLSVTGRLADLGEQAGVAGRPSDRWRDATRRRLMAVAEAEGIGATARHRASAAVPESDRPPVREDLFPRRPRGGRRLAIVAALLTGTVAVSGVSAASGDALPGETLYNVKRSTEQAQMALAGNDLGRAQLHLEFADTRMREARAVAGDDAAAALALEEAADDLRQGVEMLGTIAVESGDPAALDYVDMFANEQRWAMESMAGRFDGEARAAGEDLVALLEAAAIRSVELRGALDCTEPGGPVDPLGPVPTECSADADADGDPGRTGTESEPSGAATDPGTSSEAPADDASSAEAEAEGTVTDQIDPTTETPSDGTGDEDEGDDDGRVLDELSGIVSDLFG
ncbi:DUF5667 domain-containing protein [Glycomyces halotolerans]